MLDDDEARNNFTTLVDTKRALRRPGIYMLDVVVEFSSPSVEEDLSFYKQQCTYEGNHIPGSPFEIHVAPNLSPVAKAKRRVLVSGPASLSLQVNTYLIATCNQTISPLKSYADELHLQMFLSRRGVEGYIWVQHQANGCLKHQQTTVAGDLTSRMHDTTGNPTIALCLTLHASSAEVLSMDICPSAYQRESGLQLQW